MAKQRLRKLEAFMVIDLRHGAVNRKSKLKIVDWGSCPHVVVVNILYSEYFYGCKEVRIQCGCEFVDLLRIGMNLPRLLVTENEIM